MSSLMADTEKKQKKLKKGQTVKDASSCSIISFLGEMTHFSASFLGTSSHILNVKNRK